jgi:hypothetical protein
MELFNEIHRIRIHFVFPLYQKTIQSIYLKKIGIYSEYLHLLYSEPGQT